MLKSSFRRNSDEVAPASKWRRRFPVFFAFSPMNAVPIRVHSVEIRETVKLCTDQRLGLAVSRTLDIKPDWFED